jgi:hypothetical protein
MKAGDLIIATDRIATDSGGVPEGTLGVILKKDSGFTGLYTHIAMFTNGIFAYVDKYSVRAIKDYTVAQGRITCELENRLKSNDTIPG